MKHARTFLLSLTKPHLLVLFFLGCFLTTGSGQHIPDANFAARIRANCPTCIDASNNLLPPAASLVNLGGLSFRGITDLSGIQGFTGLETLDCSANPLTSLPSLPPSLKVLYCYGTPMTSLPNLPSSLQELHISDLITCLPNSVAGLKVYQPFSLITTPPVCGSIPCYLSVQLTSAISESSIQCIGEVLTLSALIYSGGTTNVTLAWQRKRPFDADFINVTSPISVVSGSTAIYTLPTVSTADNGTLYRADINARCAAYSAPLPATVETATIKTRQGANIADLNFRNAILRDCPVCIDNCGNLSEEAAKLISLNVENVSRAYPITDLTGIEGFLNLQVLNISSNTIRSFPRLPNNLKHLTINNNNLSSLPELPNGLEVLICKSNNLTALPALPSSLMHLDCSSNKITALPAAMPNDLMVLDCSNNELTSLPASLPLSIKTIYCQKNRISTLPTLPTSLTYFNCGNNMLSDLPPTLPTGLWVLVCSRNPNLICLPILPESLHELYISPENVKCLRNSIATLRVYDAMNEPIETPVCEGTSCVPSSTINENSTMLRTKIVGAMALKTFPNPVDKTVQVEFSVEESSAATISITDVLGRQMLAQNVEATKGLNAVTVDMSAFSRGFYMLTLQNGKTKQTLRLVKQ
jgi:Leucine-rich repeat (LRR) protein